eukprot:774514-Pyramimonas_sp.AAC.1
MNAIEDAVDQPTLQHAWAMVLMGVERELCDRYDKVGDQGAAYIGRGGPTRTKFVLAKWQPQRRYQQHGPELRAWL